MLELRFPPSHRINEQYCTALRQTIAEVLAIQHQLGNRAANNAIIEKVGVLTIPGLNEEYWAEALDYHLGLLYAQLGDAEKAAYHFDRSGTHPSSGGDQIFSGHQRESVTLRERQERAIERGIPSLVIASMPRSASASLTRTLASTLDVPIMRVSCGHYPDYHIVPRWLNSFSPGGAVLHDHFGAQPFNLKTLREAGVRHVFVRIRDPRAAAASFANLINRKHGKPDDIDYESQVIRLYEQCFIPWTNAWIEAAADPAISFKVHWVLHPPCNIAVAARDILVALSWNEPALGRYVDTLAEIKANFVSGDEDAWHRAISLSARERLWEITPESVRNLLELRQ